LWKEHTVGQTLFLFAAGMMAAQTPEMVYSPHGQPGVHEYQQEDAGFFGRMRGWFRPRNDRCTERPGLFNRMREWFGHGDRPEQYAMPHGSMPHGSMPPGTMHAGSMPPGTMQGMPQHTVPVHSGPQKQPGFSATPMPGGMVPSASTREPELAGKPLNPAGYRTGAPGTAGTPASGVQRPPMRESRISPKFVNKIGHEDDYSWVTGQLDKENGRWVIRYATPETIDRFGGVVFLAPGVDMGNVKQGDLVSATGQVQGQTGGAQYRATSINLIERGE
jgi:hypothetical protein